MKRFIVSVPGTVESSDFIVDAPDARAAAMLYLEATLAEGAEGISCDPDEILMLGEVQCFGLPERIGENLVQPWENISRTTFEVDQLIPDYEERAEGEASPAPGS